MLPPVTIYQDAAYFIKVNLGVAALFTTFNDL